ncbi:glycosyltransferase family 2 protein [Sporofaciens sp. JLR.KK001]|uniref:glycosyltransferase family 2 protein n=1 Tax=Sporofaciens sp. JLR.KK001 TaxID=3112621 RepID=UPI002FF0EDCB
MNKLVTIIIPIYKKEDTLASCLETVINQSYRDIEVILINDCSPDRCLEICNSYSLKYEFIKIIDLKENHGVSYARNQGLAIASGGYITFIDADDAVDTHYVRDMVQKIGEADILMTSIYRDYNGDVLEMSRYEAIDYIYRKDGYEGGVVGKLFRKEVAIENEFPVDVKIGEDAYYLFNCIQKSNKCIYYKKQLYHVRQSKYNSGNWMPFEKVYDTVRLLDYIIRKTNDTFGRCPQSVYEALFERSINVFMRSRYKDVPNEKKKRIRENIINYYKRFGIKGLPARYAISGIMYLLFPIAYANVIYRIYIRS